MAKEGRERRSPILKQPSRAVGVSGGHSGLSGRRPSFSFKIRRICQGAIILPSRPLLFVCASACMFDESSPAPTPRPISLPRSSRLPPNKEDFPPSSILLRGATGSSQTNSFFPSKCPSLLDPGVARAVAKLTRLSTSPPFFLVSDGKLCRKFVRSRSFSHRRAEERGRRRESDFSFSLFGEGGSRTWRKRYGRSS